MIFDAKPPKPKNPNLKWIVLALVIVVVVGCALTYRFWDYPEEHTVANFLTTLEQGNYEKAYHLWRPSSFYSYNDFMRDWGPQGDYGKIREFDILGSKSKGSRTVLVTVRINNVNPPLVLMVDRDTKGLAFSIF